MTKRDRKYGGNTDGRAADGTFGPGNPGKPKGARHKATLAAQELLDGEAEALTRKAVELALEGDTTALRLCLERIAPPRKDGPVSFDLPNITSAADAANTMARILEAVAGGEMTPKEGGAVAGLVEGFRKALETEELARRLEKLEQALEGNGGSR